MPVSSLHEVLVDLFREQPLLAVGLLSEPFQFQIPAYERVECGSNELNKVVPAEFRADAVVVLRTARQQPVLGVVVEVQLHPSKHKQWSWPAYLTEPVWRTS
jgi:hypothetical protein